MYARPLRKQFPFNTRHVCSDHWKMFQSRLILVVDAVILRSVSNLINHRRPGAHRRTRQPETNQTDKGFQTRVEQGSEFILELWQNTKDIEWELHNKGRTFVKRLLPSPQRVWVWSGLFSVGFTRECLSRFSGILCFSPTVQTQVQGELCFLSILSCNSAYQACLAWNMKFYGMFSSGSSIPLMYCFFQHNGADPSWLQAEARIFPGPSHSYISWFYRRKPEYTQPTLIWRTCKLHVGRWS